MPILCDARPVFVPLLPGTPLDLDRLAARLLAPDPGHGGQHAQQSHRASVHPRRADRHRRALPTTRRLGGHRRDLRAHPLRGRAHPHRHAARDARTAPSPSPAPPRPTALPAGGSAPSWHPRASPTPSARCTTSSPSGAPAPLQEGLAVAMETLARRLLRAARPGVPGPAGSARGRAPRRRLPLPRPEGAYYVLADFSDLSDRPAASSPAGSPPRAGVATVPGTSFFSDPARGRH